MLIVSGQAGQNGHCAQLLVEREPKQEYGQNGTQLTS